LAELDDKNIDHRSVKERICGHCGRPEGVVTTRTADNDLALIPLTKVAVLEAVHAHVEAKRRVHLERMDNNDLVYVMTDCDVGGTVLYVKVKLIPGESGTEKMLIISAHPPRRWC
jgi:hypothetical protein